MYAIEYATISEPTPETISIMKMLSGSTKIDSPTWKSPAPSQVQAVERWCRWSGFSDRSFTKTTIAATNDTEVDAVAIQPAARRGARVPPRVIASAAASGESRQTHAAAITPSPAQASQAVDVQREAPPRHGDDQPQADDDLGRGDRHDGDREHLSRLLAVVTRERDQCEVAAVEHDLQREQDDQRRAAEQHAERADREQDRADRDVPGDVRPEHRPLPSQVTKCHQARPASANGGRGRRLRPRRPAGRSRSPRRRAGGR